MGDVRFLGAFLLPMVLGLLLYPSYIRLMQRLSWGQEIRPEGPEDHLSKKGTPTTGGAVLLLAFTSVLVFTGVSSMALLALVIFTLGNGVLGLLDDWTQVQKKRSLGLKARHKLLVQFLLSAMLAASAYSLGAEDRLWVPVVGWLALPWLKVALDVFVTIATSNAVNLTDGLDGLAGGTMAIASLAYVPVCLSSGHVDLALACVGMAGACCGFLWYNCFPARIFMGDTGSLALGGFLGGLAVLTRTEFFMALVGGIFVVEALSVMIQVTYFKATGGKRIFRMSPIHHHYCKGGLHEVQVTTRFWITALILAALALFAYFSGGFGTS